MNAHVALAGEPFDSGRFTVSDKQLWNIQNSQSGILPLTLAYFYSISTTAAWMTTHGLQGQGMSSQAWWTLVRLPSGILLAAADQERRISANGCRITESSQRSLLFSQIICFISIFQDMMTVLTNTVPTAALIHFSFMHKNHLPKGFKWSRVLYLVDLYGCAFIQLYNVYLVVSNSALSAVQRPLRQPSSTRKAVLSLCANHTHTQGDKKQ